MSMQNNDKTLMERVSMVSRAAILTRHAMTDLCADYLRVVAVLHSSELSDEQRETIEDISQWFEDTSDEVKYAINHLDSFFESGK